ncbi:ankyrin repeat protein [Legionella quinlivanii]|uniref:Ankyrin repeat protein n=2 Tax=Legionella TaxID=445 RepID=A0A0W0Y399_9GAMM|nr:ankyrin repeat domain-containing protein [Legionella quinlivanii]KTD51467.1 ankyrin repeat protein [Legionella quinlivanii]SEF56114.1 hypothetical protein SAMN02746093_00448 [Legionella quinlivanii DSM 21216]STY11007.1 ankyrin repeat protein [Legionella quinlivanii]
MQRENHPIAKKIPEQFWFNKFQLKITWNDDQLIGKPFQETTRLDFPEDDVQALILLRIFYPDLQLSDYMRFAQDTLGLSQQKIFTISAIMGYLDVLQKIKDQSPDKFLILIQNKEYEAFCWAAANGHQKIIDWLASEAPNDLPSMIRAQSYDAFDFAAKSGHLHILQWMHRKAPDEQMTMLRSRGYRGIRFAAVAGHTPILDWFKKQAPKDVIAMIQHDFYYGFRLAAAAGHIDSLEWLNKEAPEELIKALQADNYWGFCFAGYENLASLKWQKEHAPDTEFPKMLKARNYQAFRGAVEYSNIDALDWFKSVAPNFLTAMIDAVEKNVTRGDKSRKAFEWLSQNKPNQTTEGRSSQAGMFSVKTIETRLMLAVDQEQKLQTSYSN